jgi:hypothetical protein
VVWGVERFAAEVDAGVAGDVDDQFVGEAVHAAMGDQFQLVEPGDVGVVQSVTGRTAGAAS